MGGGELQGMMHTQILFTLCTANFIINCASLPLPFFFFTLFRRHFPCRLLHRWGLHAVQTVETGFCGPVPAEPSPDYCSDNCTANGGLLQAQAHCNVPAEHPREWVNKKVGVLASKKINPKYVEQTTYWEDKGLLGCRGLNDFYFFDSQVRL